MYIKCKRVISTKKEKMIAKAITSKKFQQRNKKFAVYLGIKYLINFEVFPLTYHPSIYRRLHYYHSSLRKSSFWNFIFWIFKSREWMLINILESFLNQNHLENFRDEYEDVDMHIDASLYQHYFKQLNYQQQRSCLFRIYELLLELNEELSPSRCELCLAYHHNFKKSFEPERYFALNDPEVKLCFLFILSVIYPEIGNFVRDYGLNIIVRFRFIINRFSKEMWVRVLPIFQGLNRCKIT